MIKLAVDSGITDLRTIRDVYNSYAEGGHLFGPGGHTLSAEDTAALNELTQKVSNYTWNKKQAEKQLRLQKAAKGTQLIIDAMRLFPKTALASDFIDLFTGNPTPDSFEETVDRTATAMGTAGRSLKSLYGTPFDTVFGGVEGAKAFGAAGKILAIPDLIMDTRTLIKDIKKPAEQYRFGGQKRSRKATELPEVVVTPQYLSYWDATPEQTKGLTNKNGKYNTASMGDRGYTHFDTISARYKGLNAAMQRANFSEEEIGRLAPFLLTQLALEGGWVVDRPDNNFGGMMSNDKRIEFDTEDSFYDTYLKNLDARWGDEYLGKGKGWRNAKTINEYADTINREDLGLHTKEAFEEYNRRHKDHPAYIYTPLWENNNTGLMDENKFGGIYNRALGNYELLMKRMEEWDKFARNNKILEK